MNIGRLRVRGLRSAEGRKRRATLWMMGVLLALGAACAQAGNTVTTVTLVVTDAQGNVLMTTDSHGNVLARYTYRPYGTQQSGPTHAGPGYTGHVNDPATGLVYMQQRYYDADIGRFISPDPVAPTPGNVFNFNRYVYAANNPIVNIDPDGRDAVLITGPNGYKTLVIPIHLVGSGASSALAQRLGNASSAAHSPSGVTVRYVVTAKPIHGVLNTMTVSKGGNQSVCGSGGTCTNAVGGNQSYVDSTRSDLLGAVMHEGLHMAGLTDKYSTTKISTNGKTSGDANSDTSSNTMIITAPGYSNNIMALDWIHSAHKDQIINEAEHNKTTKKCTKSIDGNVSC